MIASLPMYDWPETSVHLDKFWSKIQSALLPLCDTTPAHLDRTDLHTQWQRDDVLLSQTCAYPLITSLPKSTVVIGTPTYQSEFCHDGLYASPIVVRQSDERQTLSEFHDATLAFNSRASQSGFNALKSLLESEQIIHEQKPTFFKQSIETGTHRLSVKAISDGRADICALDPVSWALAKRYDKAATQLRVLTSTAFSPALPLISSAKAIPNNMDELQWRTSVTHAFEQAIDSEAIEHLLLTGVRFIPKSRYLALNISHLDMITGQ